MKTYCLAVGLAVTALMSALAAKEPVIDATLADGIARVKRGDFAGSVAPLEKTVARMKEQKGREKDEAQARLFLGAAYAALSRDDDARREFEQVFLLGGRVDVPAEGFPPRAARLLAEEASRRGRALTPASQPQGKSKVSVVGPLLLAGGGLGAAAALHKDAKPTSTPFPRPDLPNYLTSLDVSTPVALVNITQVRFSAQVSAGCSSPHWTWDLGDGTSASAEPSLATATPSHVYQQPGEYQVVVTAECSQGTPARGFLRMFARSFSGTWLRNGFIDGHAGIYHLIQSGATLQGDCAPCLAGPDVWVGPISGSLEAGSNDSQVRVKWRQGSVDRTITVLQPYDYIYDCTPQPGSSCLALDRQP